MQKRKPFAGGRAGHPQQPHAPSFPGWSAGPDLRCAIAHRGISRFRVRSCGPPRH